MMADVIDKESQVTLSSLNPVPFSEPYGELGVVPQNIVISNEDLTNQHLSFEVGRVRR